MAENKKIDIFVDGAYVCSTKQSETCKKAIEKYQTKHPDTKEKKVTAKFAESTESKISPTRLREDIQPIGDDRSFNEVYGDSILDEDVDDMIPSNIKKLFESISVKKN